jgi:preprotein translocase subunit YajC
MTLLPIVFVFIFFYLFIIRPQNKRQKEEQKMRDNVEKGDEILTIGGFYAVVYAVEEDRLVIEMLPDRQKTTITKNAVAKVIIPEDEYEDDFEEIEDNEDESTKLNGETIDE